MRPDFSESVATQRWDTYFSEVDRLLGRIGEDGFGLRGELEAHLADSYATGDLEQSEAARLQAAIDRLGTPANYLRPLLADELLDRGTRTYQPAPIAKGLYHSLRAGSSRAITGAAFALGYLLLAAFAATALLKPLWGNHVGLFRQPDGAVSFGIIADTTGARELLGFWIIPIALAMTALLYIVLTRTLRAVRARQ